MPLRAVIFDLDQTLLDREKSLRDFLTWQGEGMLKPHLDEPAAFLARFIELDANGTVWKDRVYSSLIEEFRIEGWSTGELLSVYELCFCAFCVSRPGVDRAIRELMPTFRLGLISNGKTPFQERNFRGLGFEDAFDSILVSEAVGIRKPDPGIFLLGCAELGVAPEEAVYVGDNPAADIRGARQAGLKTIFVPSEWTPVCEDADATCTDMGELPEIIRGMGEQDVASNPAIRKAPSSNQKP